LNKIIKKAIAKINLGLLITEKRTDGFHNLETIFYPLHDIFDTLTFEKSSEYKFQTNCNLKFDETNLIYSALKALEDYTGKHLPVSIYLDKQIPMGGGLGGGSSDAATTLTAINKLFNLDLSNEILSKIAMELGSDVPFFLFSKPALAKGRGEKLMPLDIKIKGVILIINPRIHISTKEAFQNITPKQRSINLAELTNNSLFNCEKAAKTLVNDFENYTFSLYPEIGKIKISMLDKGAKLSLMSGTGSTVFGIFNSLHNAMECSADFDSGFLKLTSYDHG